MVSHTRWGLALALPLLGAVLGLATLPGRSGASNPAPNTAPVTAASAVPQTTANPAVHEASLAPLATAAATAPRGAPSGRPRASPAATSSPAQAAVASSFVTRVGPALILKGAPWTFVGVNGPSTDYAVNGGCGAAIDYAALFASLPPDSVYRTSFGQDLAINEAHQRDWAGYDQIVNAAERSPTHIKLIISLSSQSGVCDGGHFKDAAWYAGGYRNAYSDYKDDVPREPYWQYLEEVVTRYRDSPAIAMWELVGEPEASVCDPGYVGGDCYSHKTCPANASAILRSFFDSVGSEVHRLDPNHLLSDGALGGQQCGWAGSGGLEVESSLAIDVLAYHDYYGLSGAPLPEEFATRIREAQLLDKPIVSEEVGISARNAIHCTSLSARSQEIATKLLAARRAGVAGFVLWAYAGAADPNYAGCDDYIFADDPVWNVLRTV